MFIKNHNYNKQEIELYNKILSLSRNKLFYTKFALEDTFQNRINLLFFHISFIFNKLKDDKKNLNINNFSQDLFDFLFYQIEMNMRELGHGDVTVNKNMKFLVKTFYNILLFSENYSKYSKKYKTSFFLQYLKLNSKINTSNNDNLIAYFKDFETFCFDLSPNSVLKGELNFKLN